MTVLAVVQQACVESLGLKMPDGLFSGDDSRELVELQNIVQNASKEICREYDWQALKRKETITGDGSADSYNLPTNYLRMVLDAKLWSSRLSAPLRHIVSSDEWLGLETQGDLPTFGAWHVYNETINFIPAPASGETIKYFYIDNRRVIDRLGTQKINFDEDEDTFQLDEYLLKLCLIWKWKEYKGLAYAEAQATYARELERQIARDGGGKKIIVGTVRMPGGYDTSYPYNVGV
jgi:hypothetical protein